VTSCDTNILFAACDRDSPFHAVARQFLFGFAQRDDFCLCEQVLMELYCLLRNPSVSSPPLGAPEAAQVIDAFRSNLRWRIVDVVPGYGIMDEVWRQASGPAFAYRRIFDIRLAAVLRHHGVTDFATRNARDFSGVGFIRVWNPLDAS
jgi:toxin-antitoxin system PIN domain toxin